jgi:cysteine desulfurase
MALSWPAQAGVYLDYNATAPLRPEAARALVDALNLVANASSAHGRGREAAWAVERGRQQVAALVGCAPGELIFTSGATEANNLAIQIAARSGRALLTSTVEHPAVLNAARALSRDRGVAFHEVPVDPTGRVVMRQLEHGLGSYPASLVSIMAANNETGTLNDLQEVVERAHRREAWVHTDATQLVGRLPLDLATLDVDLLSLSAHKFGGPQGVGALFIRRGVPLPHHPLMHGGEQERGWRPGTLNVAGIAATGAAAEACLMHQDAEVPRIRQLRDRLENTICAAIPDAVVNGCREHRLPGTSNITFPGAPGDAVMAAMPNVAVSDGSACSSGAPGPSRILLAMGLPTQAAECSLRFSLGYATTDQDVDTAARETLRSVQAVLSAMAHV